jgi:outer membrane murein-binding lipoprotein Lpp
VLSSTKIILVASAVSLGLLIAPAPARAAEPTVDDLKNQLAQLQSRLDALEKNQTAASADVARTVQEIVRDAEKRSVLLQTSGDFTAGHDGKAFILRSSDGNFVLRPGIEFQFRNVTNYRDENPDDGESDLQNGFEVRRLRLRFDGNLFTPKLTYLFRWDTSRTSGGLSLLDSQVQYQLSENWAIKVGQYKESVFHEKDVSFKDQLAVDRTLVDSLIGGNVTDRVQGIALIYGGNDKTPIRIETDFNDGANSKNTDFQDGPTNFGSGLRAEYKLAGKWFDYKDFTARQTKQDLLVFGAGAQFTESGDTDSTLATVDAQFETPTGWSLYGALHGRFLDDAGESSFDWGAIAQAGYSINPRWEPFVRYDIISLDDNASGESAYNEFAIGVTRYLGENGSAGNRAKITVDVLYLPDGAPSNQTGIGVLASDEAEFVLRTQLQLIL